MTQKDRELLLKDLCARLPYGVICKWESDGFSNVGELTDICHHEGVNGFKYWDGYFDNDGEDIPIEIIKPYLRSMSSITEDELAEFVQFPQHLREPSCKMQVFNYNELDWLNAHHFDYRGLIEKGLALEAPKDMYIKNQ